MKGTGSNRSSSEANWSPDGPLLAETLRTYRELLGEVDRWFCAAVEALPGQVGCRKGCAECCRGLFDITLLDALLLRRGFRALDRERRAEVTARCGRILKRLERLWPGISPPYLLNVLPESEWERLMPDDDETPCVFLDRDGGCMVYDERPMTCRLHGLPLVDRSGEIVHDEWCTHNLPGLDPSRLPQIRGDFLSWFRREAVLLAGYTERAMGRPFRELDTFIPLAPLVSLETFDWKGWLDRVTIVENPPLS